MDFGVFVSAGAGRYGTIQVLDLYASRNLILQPDGGNVGIGTTTPNANAILDLTSTTKAFMPPRMTTTQRDAVASPTEGMVIFNITTHVLNYYGTAAWAAV
jgi:hypothetical protein